MTEMTRKKIWDTLTLDFEPSLELAGNLAFTKHEGKPKGFTFLVGTDAVWPAIEEVLSADFGIPDEKKLFKETDVTFDNSDPDKIKLMKAICESNYSLFQIFGAAGFYNTGASRFVKIIRLRQPSEEEQSRGEKVTDLDDLFCFCLQKIHEVAKEEKACIVSTEGDGKVRIYTYDKKKRHGDLLFVWSVTSGDINYPIPLKVVSTINNFLGNPTDRSGSLLKVIRKISTTVGEGAMLILVENENDLNNFFATMEYLRPQWQKNLTLTVPKELLRAALVMDGLILIIKGSKIKVEPRYAVYPFKNEKAYGLLQDLFTLEADATKQKIIIKKLVGKGSKTHGAANLSHLKNVKIITISSDGPIKLWPDELTDPNMRNMFDIHTNLGAMRSGVFPWNEHLGDEFAERTKHQKVDMVLDLCAGSGHLGMTVTRVVGAKRVVLVEIDAVSCQLAKTLWKSDNQRTVCIIQGDIRNLTPILVYNGLVVSNPPCAPLPDSFHAWRNVYGGRDGLLYVSVICKWLLQYQNTVFFFIATYFLSQTKEISIENLSKVLGIDGVIIKNIYHFKEPAWNWFGISDEKNPGYSEEIFARYFNYCKDDEKEVFLKFLRNKPYTHHILIEGKTLEKLKKFD